MEREFDLAVCLLMRVLRMEVSLSTVDRGAAHTVQPFAVQLARSWFLLFLQLA